jgi:hypothetical protein
MTAAFVWWSGMRKHPKNHGVSDHRTETVINRRSSKGPLKERNKAGRGEMINGRQERLQDAIQN